MKKILREGDLRKMVRECIHNFINESFVINEEQLTGYSGKLQKKMTKYLKDKIESGDENTLSLFHDMGYDLNYNYAQRQKDIAQLQTKDGIVSQKVADDIIRVAEILSKYTNSVGNVYLRRDVDVEKNKGKDDRRYVEDDYHGEELLFIERMKKFMELNGLTYLYDKSANMSSRKYGMNDKYDDTSNLNFNQYTDDEIKSYIKKKVITPATAISNIKAKILDGYMKAKYGMELDVPTISFSNGNDKLPKQTLIVNFATAVGCPAWNECIVKHACYARNGEKRMGTVFNANNNKALMWKATKDDPEFMNLLMQFVRSQCVDFDKAANKIISLKLTNVRGKNNLMEKLSTTPFSDTFFTPEIIEILKNHKKINNIRLNENGDFIGQWLVDAWDREAGEFKIIDINTSAYTCRHLNYEGIKNIILNASFIDDKGKIARHFIAVPDNIYNQLDETYVGKNNQITLKNGSVTPNYQPLFNVTTKKPNGRVYYKCPCGREIGKREIDCYECQVCYNPNTNPEQTIVFVKSHGSMSNALLRKSLGDTGISRSMLSLPEYNRETNDVENKLEVASVQKPNDKIINEEYNTPTNNTSMAERLGIKTVTNNAIKSLYNKLG